MKQVVIVGPAYPYRGGQALDEAHIYNTLTQAGYHVETVSFKLLYPSILFPGTTQYDKSSEPFFPHTEKIHRLLNSVNPLSWYKGYQKIKALNADLVLFIWWMPFFGPCFGSIAKWLRKNTKSKVVFLVENFVSHERRWFDLLFTKWTLKKAHAFMTLSGHIKERVQEHFPSKKIEATTLPIYDFYDFGKLSKAQSLKKLKLDGKKVILFFGLIRKYKGLDQLIRTMPLLLLEEPNIHLLAVGECYDQLDAYTSIVEELNLKEHVSIVDKFVPNEQVELYFKPAELVCLPYYHGTQSGILMMAYGFKKPVVVTDVGGIGELVAEQKTGIIVPNNEPEVLAKGIMNILNSQEKFSEHIEQLASTLGHKDFATIISELIEYKEPAR